MNGKLIIYGTLLLYLLCAAAQDIRTKQVSVKWAKVIGVVGIVYWMVFRQTGFLEWFLGVIPGLGMLFLGAVSRESVGYGDGIIACICGLFLGFWGCMQVLVFGLFLSGPVSLFLIASGRAKRRTRIAFIPFFMLGYLAWLVMKV